MSGPEVHHVIQQVDRRLRDHAIIELVGGDRFMQSNFNLLVLANDRDVARATGIQRHASNHAWIAQAQRAVLDEFLNNAEYQGIAVKNIIDNPSAYADQYVAVRQRATVLVNDLRDVTANAIINKQLPLTYGDDLFPDLTEADVRARAAEVLSPDRFTFTADGTATTASSELVSFRAARDAILDAGGDVRWMAFDTPEKITAYVNSSAEFRVAGLSNRATIESLERYLKAIDPTGSSLDNTVFAQRIPQRTWSSLPLAAKLGVVALGLSMISTGAQAATAGTPQERNKILQDAGVALGIEAVLMTTGLSFLPATLISIAAYGAYSYSTDPEFREAVNDHVEVAGAVIPQVAQRIINGEGPPSGVGIGYAPDPNAPAVPVISGVVTAPPSGSDPGGQTVGQYFAGLEAELNTPVMSRGKIRSPLPNGEYGPWIVADVISIGGIIIGFVVREQNAPQVAMWNGSDDATFYDAPYGRLFMVGPNSAPDAEGIVHFHIFAFASGAVPTTMGAAELSQSILNTALQEGVTQQYGSSVEQLSSTPNTSIIRIVNRVTQQVEIRVAQSGGYNLPINSATIVRDVTAEWSFSQMPDGQYGLTRTLYDGQRQKIQDNTVILTRESDGSFQFSGGTGEGIDDTMIQEFERMAQSLAPALNNEAETVIVDAPGRDLASAIERGAGPVRVPIAILRSEGDRIAEVATRIVADRLSRNGGQTVDPEQFEAEYASQVRTIQLAGNIGQVFGSTLGRAIAGNDRVAQMALSGVLGALTESAGQAIATGFAADSLSQGIDTGFAELPANLKSAALGAVSSVLTAELIGVIGLNGISGELANAMAGSVIGEIVNNIAAGRDALAGIGSPVSLGAAVGSLLGNKLANEVISFDTVGGQIGAAIGSSLAVIGGTAYLYSIGFIPGLLPVAALAFVGNLVGGLIGSIFGGTPRSGADVVWDEAKKEFTVTNVYSRKGGSKDAARDMAASVSNSLNGIIAASGGTLLHPAAVQVGNYGMRKKDYVYRPYSTRDEDAITARFSGKTGADSLVSYGLQRALSDPDFQLAGGSVYVKRAIYARVAADRATGGLNSTTLLGDIAVAQDWAFYRDHPGLIEAIAGTMPEGAERDAYLAGWTITTVRAGELGLDRRAASDWFGGFSYALSQAGVSAALVEFSFDYDLASNRFGRRQQYAGYVVGDAIDVAGQDLIEGTAANDVIVLSGASIVAGSAGVKLNGGAFDGEARTIEVAAQIEAGAGDDTVHASDRGDTMFGDGGNDTLYGGRLDDWLLGGEGNDVLHAGSQTGGLGGDGNLLDGGTGNDQLHGGEGSDWLEGGDGTDTLNGGTGDDVLAGGAGEGDDLKGGLGHDQYVVRAGDGADVIEDDAEGAPTASGGGGDYVSQRMAGLLAGTIKKNWVGTAAGVSGNGIVGGEDAIVFGVGIDLRDIVLVRSSADADDLIIRVMKTQDGAQVFSGTQLTVKDWFANSFKRVEWLKFADGTEIRIGDITSFIIGGDGDDVLIGTAGNDFVYGGGGNDAILLFGGDDIGNGGAGNDMVAGHEGRDLLIGGLGVDQLIGGKDKDVLSGDGSGDDLYGGDADDILSGGRGDGDVVIGGAGDDTFKYSRGDGHDVMLDEFADHWDVVWTRSGGWNGAAGYSYNETTGEVTGPGGILVRKNMGTVAAPNLQWLGRYDYDIMTETLKLFTPPVGAAITANAGIDTVEFALGINLQDVVLRRVGNDLVMAISSDDQEVADYGTVKDGVTIKDWYLAPGQIEKLAFYATGLFDISASDRNLIAGTDDADGTTTAPLAGTALADWITAGAGDDVLAGGDADDIIAGNSGSDTLRGEAGDDVLYGGTGNDILDGGAGKDVLIGGSGVDTASYASAFDALRVRLGSASNNSGDAAGDEYSSIENIIGGSASDDLGGDEGENEITGGAGNDLLMGGAGGDTYVWTAASGDDTIREGAFIVEEVVTAAGVLADGYTATWTNTGESSWDGNFHWRLEIRGPGNELVYDYGLYSYPSGADMPPPATWNAAGWLGGFANTDGQQVTRDKIDTSFSGGDQDVIEFAAGISLTDLTFIRASNGLADANGPDLIVRYNDSAATQITIKDHFTVYGRIETLQFNDGLSVSLASVLSATSGAALNGTAELDLVVGQTGLANDLLYGGAGDDVLSGLAGDDELYGEDGDDVLEGGLGADRLDGGGNPSDRSGDTVRYVNSTAVTIDLGVTTAQSGGHAEGDTLFGIENVVGSLTDGDTIAGDAGANIIDGLGGDNVIAGNDGDDVLIAGSGNDILRGDVGEDNISAGEGNDQVWGGADDDILAGGGGDDQLRGEAGNDQILGGDGNDVILDGGAGDDEIYGGAGRDDLTGSDGNDRLGGGSGADTLQGGAGDDYYFVQSNDGADIITDATGSNIIGLDQGISHQQIWLTQAGSDLKIGVIGQDTSLTVSGFFAVDAPSRIKSIQTSTHALFLDHPDTLNLISAMTAASATVPATVPQTVADAQARYWHLNGKAKPMAPATVRAIAATEDVAITIDGNYGVVDHDNDISGYQLKPGSGPLKGVISNFDPATGALTYTPNADANGTDSFVVIAVDANGQVAELPVNVTIAAINDAPGPISVKGGGALTISESAPGAILAPGTVVGEFESVDVEGDTLTYTLESDAGGRFAITAEGRLILADPGAINFEASSSHVVRVRVTDAHGASREQDFSVAVDDRNEGNSLPASYSFAVGENVSAGTIVDVVAASDLDQSGAFASQRYYFWDGTGASTISSDGRYIIDAVSGQIQVNSALDFEAPSPSQTYQVVAQDNAGAPGYNQAQSAVTIAINDVNEAPVSLDWSPLVPSITERDRIGSGEARPAIALGTLSVTDPDTAGFPNALYSLALNDTRFELIGNTLWLKADVSVDFEAGASVSVEISATDQSSAPFTITRTFDLAVADRDDLLEGTADADTLTGQSGRDLIYGFGGTDIVEGNDGHDVIEGGDGDDILRGGSGVDRITGGAGNDDIVGGDGDDNGVWHTGVADGGLFGGVGHDTIVSGAGADLAYGEEGDDIFVIDEDGGNVWDRFDGGEGRDTITYANFSVGASIDLSVRPLAEEPQTAYQYGDLFTNIEDISGSAFADSLAGNEVANRIYGMLGNDTIGGGLGDDTLDGGEGNDMLSGDDGADTLIGGVGDDIIYGGTGNDVLLGGEGNDQLYAESGDDMLNGGEGDDILNGGIDNDTYIINRMSGADIIQNYDPSGNDIDVIGFQDSMGAINDQDLWFERVGNDLKISIIGTASHVQVVDWYLVADASSRANHKIDFIVAGDRYSRTINIEALTNLMATQVKPLTIAERDTLMADHVYRANWATHWGINAAPALSAIATQSTIEDSTQTIVVTATDDITPNAQIQLSAQVISGTNIVTDAGISFGAADANGVRSMIVNPIANASGTARIRVTATDAGGVTSAQEFDIVVSGVADTPTIAQFTSAGGTSGYADGIALNLGSSFADLDGSEAHEIWITGVPAGVSLSAGSYDSEIGAWKLTPAQLSDLKVHAPAGWSQDLDLRATARASENGQTAVSAPVDLKLVINAAPTGVSIRGLGTSATPWVHEYTPTNDPTGKAVGTAAVIDPDMLDRNLLPSNLAQLPLRGIGEERIVTAAGPFGGSVQVVETGQNGNVDDPHGGGLPWLSAGAADTSRAYKFTIYFKPQNNMGHSLYFGTGGNIENAWDGQANDNPYFYYANSSDLVQDRWYRVEGYILPSGTALIGNETFGGVFDTVTEQKVADTFTYRFGPGASETGARFFSFYNQGNAGDSAQWYQPTIEKLEYSYQLLDSADGRFAINSVTGLITASGANLDYEASTAHNITVRVTDSFGEFRDQTVAVGVGNVNETPNAPNGGATIWSFFDETGLGSNPANAYVGVAAFPMSDPDGTVPTLQFTSDGNPNNWFYIDGNVVRFNPGLDFSFEWARNAGYSVHDWNEDGRLEAHVANVYVQASDESLTSGSTLLQVFISDVNERPDNLSLISQTLYSETVGADTPHSGQVIANFAMSDPDQTIPSLVITAGNENGWFTANDAGQLLFTGANFSADWLRSTFGGYGQEGRNYDTDGDGLMEIRVATLTLSARDGSGVESDPFTYNVYIENKNEAPSAPSQPGNISIYENTTGDTGLVFSGAADPDGDGVSYVFADGSTVSGQFSIVDGNRLYVNSAFDYEAQTSATVSTVYAWANGQRSGDGVSLTTFIVNANDHMPVLSAPGSFTIPENYQPGLTFGQASATDADGTQPTFRIVSGNINDAFAINPGTGELSVTWNGVDYESANWLSDESGKYALLTIAADDGGSNIPTATIRIDITNIRKYVYNNSSIDTSKYETRFQNTRVAGGELDMGWGRDNWYNESWLVEKATGNVLLYLGEYSNYEGTTSRPFPHGGTPAAGYIANQYWSRGDPWPAPAYTLYADDEHINTSVDGAPFGNPYLPVVFDLAGDGFDLISVFESPIVVNMFGDNRRQIMGWVESTDAILALDRNGDGLVGDLGEISFVKDREGATTDLEGLTAFDSNGDMLLDANDTDFGKFVMWRDYNQDGIGQTNELLTLAAADIMSISLERNVIATPFPGSANIVSATAAFQRGDGTQGRVGDVGLAWIPMPDATNTVDPEGPQYRYDPVTGQYVLVEAKEPGASGALGNAPPIVLDLDADNAGLVSLGESKTRFDMNGDGVGDRTGWIEAGDALLALDRNGNGAIDGIDEISFVKDKAGARTDLEGLAAFDSNGDGKLDGADARFVAFRAWRDGNANGVTDAGELLSLAEAGVVSISLTGTPTGETGTAGSNIVYNKGSFTRATGASGTLLDVGLAFKAMSKLPEIEFQTSDWNGKARNYTVTGDAAAARVTPRHASGVLSADAGQIAPAAMLSFSDRTVGLLSMILVDLDGDGLEAKRAGRSRAAFDMDVDGVADNTGWVSGGDGLLVIDRDGSGSITHASELSFLSEKDGATSAWDGLSVLDNMRDGKIDAKDARFGELKVWADRDGDGVSQTDEVKTLAELGITEIGLRSVASGESARIGDNLPLSTATFKWANGVTATIGNVAMAFDPSSAKGETGAAPTPPPVNTAYENAAALAASRLVQAMNGFGAGMSEGSLSARWTEQQSGIDMLAARVA